LRMTSHQHPYYQEGQRIVASLQRLPNLKHLSILPPRDGTRSASSESVLGHVLAWVEKNRPMLQSLYVSMETVSLKCLSGLKNLRSLHLAGFSLTSPEATSQLLGEMKCLQELIVVGPPEGLRWRQSLGYDLRLVQSITPNVIRKMNPLRSVTLCELNDTQSQPPAFLTKGLLVALYQSHCDTLQDLRLSSATAPDASIQEFIVAFLMSTTNIRSLAFGWQNIQVDFLDCLPATIQRLEVAVQSTAHAQAVLERLMMIMYRLRYLRRVTFHLINPVQQVVPEHEKEEVSFAMPMQSMSMYVC